MFNSEESQAPAVAPDREEVWYKVSTPEYDTVAHDPLDPFKRYHTGIFVETDPSTSKGTQFHVTGDIIAASGMRFEVKNNYVPGETKYYHRTTDIGWIRKADYPRIKPILEALPRPTKQQGIGAGTFGTCLSRYIRAWPSQVSTPPPYFTTISSFTATILEAWVSHKTLVQARISSVVGRAGNGWKFWKGRSTGVHIVNGADWRI